MTQEHVLLVEDDERLREQLARALRSRAHAVTEAGTLAELRSLRHERGQGCAGVDLHLPDGTGLAAVRELLAEEPTLRIVVLTGYGSIATAVEAVRLGALDYLTKPADVDQILAALDSHDGACDPPPSLEPPSLQRVEWEHIQRVLRDSGGNVSRAARALGIHRRTLQRKLSYRPPRR